MIIRGMHCLNEAENGDTEPKHLGELIFYLFKHTLYLKIIPLELAVRQRRLMRQKY